MTGPVKPQIPTTVEIDVVPETLSAAQSEMNARNPGTSTDVLKWIEFHRYNAEMFRLAGERLAELGRTPLDGDWPRSEFTRQTAAMQRNVRRLAAETKQPIPDHRLPPGLLPGVEYIPLLPPRRFGDWLRDTCTIAGVDLVEVADRTGLPAPFLEKVVRGQEPMRSLHDVAAVADALRVDRAIAAVIATRDFRDGCNGWADEPQS
ncbi:helix-turn-helix domain-containing protein [Amycolatopsis sp. NPDC098790]|uniref:helix-turn-helix domain-containing protein n=1 Tax=Amycolatopsis sp. NPDC098790 TaxID=3363939 RepID=UPI003825B965